MHYLITAGPTREFIDDVRYISNASSGRMGCALVRAAMAARHRVTFVCGPIELDPPDCDVLVRVVSAEDMRRAVLEHAPAADAVVMAAAVADYRPASRTAGKLKKSAADLILRLTPTADILAELGRAKTPRQVLVGFALESSASDPRANALRKLREKNLDLIVLNGPAALGAELASVELLFASGKVETIETAPKSQIAATIVAAIEELPRR